MSKTNEKRHIEWHETCKCKCRLDASVCRKSGIEINADVNVKNYLTKEYVIKNLFEIQVIANVINRVMWVNTWIMKIVNAEKTSW